MADSSVDGDYEGTDATDSENEGYAEPGGYSDPSGTTGYSGLTSNYPDESGYYDASVGAALGVLGPLVLDLGLGGLIDAFAAEGSLTAQWGGMALMLIDMGLEGGAAVMDP
jgi:hypothetical protein